MDQQAVKTMAQRALNALGDNRVMFSADNVESITDLKNVLRALTVGTLVLTQPTDNGPPVAEE
jgi:predicted TIM-barrel fold metal-dependent hydrolase